MLRLFFCYAKSTVGVGVLDDPTAQRQCGIFPKNATHFPAGRRGRRPLHHRSVRIPENKKEQTPEGICSGTPEGTRLRFRPGMGENRCAAPSSRRRRRSSAPHFDVRVLKKQKDRTPEGIRSGTPEGTRTPDLLIRSQSLYPTELPAHVQSRLLRYINTGI